MNKWSRAKRVLAGCRAELWNKGRKFIESDFPRRCHFVAGVLLILFFLTVWMAPTSIIPSIIIAACFAASAIGFLSRTSEIFPLHKKTYIKFWLPAVQLALAIPATVLAREIVATATGLPASDFPWTVAVYALPMYIVLSLAVAAVLSIIVVLLRMVLVVISAPLLLPPVERNFRTILLRVFRKDSGFLKPDKDFSAEVMACLIGGIIAFSVFASSAVQLLNLIGNAQALVRKTAFFCDYSFMARYPSGHPDERIILHENGIISYARLENGDAVITVSKVEFQ